jgi:hypothetical protein
MGIRYGGQVKIISKIVKKSPQKIPQPNPIENESPKNFMSHKSKNP